jgi:hypothetical protein
MRGDFQAAVKHPGMRSAMLLAWRIGSCQQDRSET